MGDYSWIAKFRPQKPGDKEYVDGMVALYGPDQDRICDPDKAFAHFKKGVELGNLRCVTQMHYCYEQGWGVPQDVNEAFNWTARALALERDEPDWRDWTWTRHADYLKAEYKARKANLKKST